MAPRPMLRVAARVLHAACLIVLVAALPFNTFAQEPPAPVAPAAVPDYVPLSNVRSIAAGTNHTCAVTTAGALKCWGVNTNGRLGNNSTLHSSVPVDVVGLSNSVLAVSAGSNHTCALISGGTVRCWGDNSTGQIGQGVFNGVYLTPQVVPNLTGVTSISLGLSHACAVLSTGAVRCWGANTQGQLGTGNTTNQPSPVAVSGLPAVTTVIAGHLHTCAIATAGPLWCWGYNGTGQVGDGAMGGNRTLPIQVFTPAVKAAGAGAGHTCAIEPSGRTWCWGANERGQLGDGSTTSRPFGAYVNLLGVNGGGESLELGLYHSCARTPSGSVLCWGAGENLMGTNAPGPNGSLIPVDIAGLPGGVTAVAAAQQHNCARTEDGHVYCWGYNGAGLLGDATQIARPQPKLVLVPATCYRLTRLRSGSNGGVPVAFPAQSDGCPIDHFVAGSAVQVQASPAGGQRVRAWQGVAVGTPGATSAMVTMPAADSTLAVLYGTCHLLTLSASGGGGPLYASPANSLGCGNGRYGVSDRITLVASPSGTQRVASWTGAAVAPGTGMDVNSVVMPDADKAVSVAYEACLALSVSVQGEGDIPIVYPAQSQGCAAASTYAAGESITLVARPAPGYLVGGWQGTVDAAPFAAAQFTMPAGGASVGVTYAPATHSVYLPSIAR